jgi:ABC-2 type transport system permease protein
MAAGCRVGQCDHLDAGTRPLFPLKWMTQGMRSVFLPDSYASQEPTGSWEHGRVAVLLIWCVAGLLVSIRTFCWRSREDG